MSIRHLWIVLLVCIVGCTQHTRVAPWPSDRIVVMISLDGFAYYYLDDPKADVPTLRKLARWGARAQWMRASTPTVTWPNHTTLVTGDNPARHGVVGNNYYDRKADRRVTLISDPELDKDQIVKVPTLYDIAHEEGIATVAIRWPATRNAKTLDWTIPAVASAELQNRYSTPGLLNECRAARLIGKAASRPATQPDAHLTDAGCTDIFDYILRTRKPGFGLLHLVDPDHIQHLNGPRSPEAYAAMAEADRLVKRVWGEMNRDYPGRATLVIVSDHGFSPIERRVVANIVLEKAGLARVEKNQIVGGDVRVVAQGGCAMIYIVNESRREEIVSKVREAFKDIPGIDKIVGPGEMKHYGVADPKDDPNAPDMILLGKEGTIFGDTAAGGLPFEEKPERRGSHGHNADIPDLHAIFIACGAGVKEGVNVGKIENIDVAPTVARLMGVPMTDVDGKVMTEMLKN